MVTNGWFYMRMLSEDIQDLEGNLQDALALAEKTNDTVFYYLNTTWAEYNIICGDPAKALDHWIKSWESCQRYDKGRVGYYLVRLLVALDRHKEAEDYARQALSLTVDAPRWLHRHSILAFALAVVGHDPATALKTLNLLEAEISSCAERVWVAVPLLKQLAVHLLGQEPFVLESDVQNYLNTMGYNEHLEYLGSRKWVDAMLHPSRSTAHRLKIFVLGQSTVELDGVLLDLSPKQLEIIVLLAKHPEGLSGEALLLELYGETGGYGNLKALISRLRRTLPIESQPYRLSLDHTTDFQEFQHFLRQGKLEEAIRLYAGPLLEHSQAPGIETLRNHLEQHLRAAAESTDDPQLLFQLAERLGEDLEVWEKTLGSTSRTDPRHPYVLSRVMHLRKELGVI